MQWMRGSPMVTLYFRIFHSLTAGSLICYSCEYQFSGQHFRDLVDWWIVSSFQEKNHRNLNRMARKVCSPINQGNSKLKEVFPPASGRVCFGQCFSSDDPFWVPVLWHCWGLFGFRSVARGARVRKLKQGRFLLLLLANGLFLGIIWVGQMMRWCQVINGIPRKVKMRNPYLHHCTDVLRYLNFTIAFFWKLGIQQWNGLGDVGSMFPVRYWRYCASGLWA